MVSAAHNEGGAGGAWRSTSRYAPRGPPREPRRQVTLAAARGQPAPTALDRPAPVPSFLGLRAFERYRSAS